MGTWEGLQSYNPEFDRYRKEYHELDVRYYRPWNAELPMDRQRFETAVQNYLNCKKKPVPREFWSFYYSQGWDPTDDGRREKEALITAANSYSNRVRDIAAVAADIAASRRDAMNLPGLQWTPSGYGGHILQISQWDNIANNERQHAMGLMSQFDFLKAESDQLRYAYAGGYRLVYTR